MKTYKEEYNKLMHDFDKELKIIENDKKRKYNNKLDGGKLDKNYHDCFIKYKKKIDFLKKKYNISD